MKLAYLATSKIPSRDANSVHVMKMCSAFSNAHALSSASDNISVTMFAPDTPDIIKGIENVYDYYGVEENFKIEKVALKYPYMSKMRSFRFSCAIAGFVSRRSFDVIYGRDVMACSYLARKYRRPVIIECHTPLKSNKFEYYLLRRLLKSEYLKKIVVITNALKQHFISEYRIDEKKIYVAPDGADAPPVRLLPAALDNKSANMLNIGYIGHLYKGKGMEIIEQAAPKCPFAFFHIIGGTENDISYWKNKCSNTGNIHFYGHIPHGQTINYGMSMDVLIAPYKKTVGNSSGSRQSDNIAQWMSPLKIFEYMALGKPVIASDLPVIREVLTDGENALLCPPDYIEAWISAIIKINEDKEFANTIAQNALRDFEKYTWKARAKNILGNVIYTRAGDR